MLNTATVTGKTGPGGQLTAQLVKEVNKITFDFEHSMISIDSGSPARTLKVAWTSIATVSFSITAGVAAITIST